MLCFCHIAVTRLVTEIGENRDHAEAKAEFCLLRSTDDTKYLWKSRRHLYENSLRLISNGRVMETLKSIIFLLCCNKQKATTEVFQCFCFFFFQKTDLVYPILIQWRTFFIY